MSGLSEATLDWTERLTGLPPSKVRAACAEVADWGVPHLTAELCHRDDIDAAVGAVFLKRRRDELVRGGVDPAKLRSKLKGDPDVWAAWAEIVAGGILADHFQQHGGGAIELLYEPAKSTGAHSDYHLVARDTDFGGDIEFKAVGLSAAEISFFKQAASLLPEICPERGVVSAHRAIEHGFALTVEQTNELRLAAGQPPEGLPAHVSELRGAVVVAHATENGYLDRLRDRFESAFRQLRPQHDGWVAFWWSNGAPFDIAVDLMSTVELPEHLAGVIFVGAGVAVPWAEIHYLTAVTSRGASRKDSFEFESFERNGEVRATAELVVQAFQRSSGVRPTLVADPSVPSPTPVLFRDGSRPILPFNLLMDKDPPSLTDQWPRLDGPG